MGFWSWFKRDKRKKMVPSVETSREEDEDYLQLQKELMGLEFMFGLKLLKDLKADQKMRHKCELMARKRKKRGLGYRV